MGSLSLFLKDSAIQPSSREKERGGGNPKGDPVYRSCSLYTRRRGQREERRGGGKDSNATFSNRGALPLLAGKPKRIPEVRGGVMA